MLKEYNKKPYVKQAINSVFIVFESKETRDVCVETFERAVKEKPILIRIKNFILSCCCVRYN
jgi:hypothetical protein